MLKRGAQGQFTLVDLESRNGVYLNGVKVHSALLHDGDNIQLGTVVFVFHEGRGALVEGP
jgi:pSer/pThr/pTyr-binding forkhead associated (FHA) protein